MCDTFHTADGSDRNTENSTWKTVMNIHELFVAPDTRLIKEIFIFLNGFFFSESIHSVTKIQVYRIFEVGYIAELMSSRMALKHIHI